MRAIPRPPNISVGFVKSFLIILFVILLTGCAAQRAYSEGRALVEKGEFEAGIRKLETASELEPRNVEFRSALLQLRARSVATLLANAEQVGGDTNIAETNFKRVLSLEAGNDRAIAGLARLRMRDSHSKRLSEASTALERKQLEVARSAIERVLREDPSNERAKALASELENGDKSPNATETTLSDAFRKPINLELDDGTLKQAFMLIAHASGLNFIYDREVKLDQKISMLLRNSTVESALFYTLMTNQLEHQVVDASTVLIYPNNPAKLKDYQEMVFRTFHLSHADAKNVANHLRTFVKSKDIGVDEKLNAVTIRDTAEAISVAEKLVALQDVPEPEVMLELEVLEVNRSRLQQLGISWPDSLTLTPLVSGSGLTARDLLHNLNPDTIGAAIGPVSVRAKKTDSNATILANPRIRVRNREKAKIMVGERLPNITTTANATGFIAETINYVDVGLKLDVEPTISLNDDVAIRVSLEVSSIVGQLQSKAGTTAYQLGTRNASTFLSLKDGETQILAGLINDTDRSDATKVPALGDIPLLGRLFGTNTDNGQKTEVVLSITPRLVRNIRRPDAGLVRFRSGTETSFRVRPLGSAQVAPRTAPSVTVEAPKLLPVQISAGTTPVVAWQGPVSAKVGENIAVQLDLGVRGMLDTLAANIRYDNKVLKLIGVVEGNYLKQDNAVSTFHTQVDQAGNITLRTSRSSTSPVEQPGTLAQLRFQPITPTESTAIVLTSIRSRAPDGAPTPPVEETAISIKVESAVTSGTDRVGN